MERLTSSTILISFAFPPFPLLIFLSPFATPFPFSPLVLPVCLLFYSSPFYHLGTFLSYLHPIPFPTEPDLLTFPACSLFPGRPFFNKSTARWILASIPFPCPSFSCLAYHLGPCPSYSLLLSTDFLSFSMSPCGFLLFSYSFPIHLCSGSPFQFPSFRPCP